MLEIKFGQRVLRVQVSVSQPGKQQQFEEKKVVVGWQENQAWSQG